MDDHRGRIAVITVKFADKPDTQRMVSMAEDIAAISGLDVENEPRMLQMKGSSSWDEDKAVVASLPTMTGFVGIRWKEGSARVFIESEADFDVVELAFSIGYFFKGEAKVVHTMGLGASDVAIYRKFDVLAKEQRRYLVEVADAMIKGFRKWKTGV